MTARVWTVEELDRVHPLPDGWEWLWLDGQWVAHATKDSDVASPGDIVGVFAGTVCMSDGYGPDSAPPDDVALAVILASKGLDSLGAMADAMDGRKAEAEREAQVHALVRMARCEGRAEAWSEAAAMLRRGRVAP